MMDNIIRDEDYSEIGDDSIEGKIQYMPVKDEVELTPSEKEFSTKLQELEYSDKIEEELNVMFSEDEELLTAMLLELGELNDYYNDFIQKLNELLNKEKVLNLNMIIPETFISRNMFTLLESTPDDKKQSYIYECMNVFKEKNFLKCLLTKLFENLKNEEDIKVVNEIIKIIEPKVIHYIGKELR